MPESELSLLFIRPLNQFGARCLDGRPVTVSYQPESPNIAVLEPGAGLLSWIMPVACLLVSPATPLLALARRLWRRRSRLERDRRTDARTEAKHGAT